MAQKITDLSELIMATEGYMQRLGYAELSLVHLHSGWNKLKHYVAAKGNPPYTPVVGLAFLHDETGYPAYHQSYKDSYKRALMIRGVRLLNDYQEFGSIAARSDMHYGVATRTE